MTPRTTRGQPPTTSPRGHHPGPGSFSKAPRRVEQELPRALTAAVRRLTPAPSPRTASLPPRSCRGQRCGRAGTHPPHALPISLKPWRPQTPAGTASRKHSPSSAPGRCRKSKGALGKPPTRCPPLETCAEFRKGPSSWTVRRPAGQARSKGKHRAGTTPLSPCPPRLHLPGSRARSPGGRSPR